ARSAARAARRGDLATLKPCHSQIARLLRSKRGDLHEGSRQIDHELIVLRRPAAFAPLHFSHKSHYGTRFSVVLKCSQALAAGAASYGVKPAFGSNPFSPALAANTCRRYRGAAGGVQAVQWSFERPRSASGVKLGRVLIKSPSRVRFWAKRTSSRHRRMTESDPNHRTCLSAVVTDWAMETWYHSSIA